METLAQSYQDKLAIIAEAIQESELLSAYLEEEGEQEYKEMIDAFEPVISELYEEVVAEFPLQILDLENRLTAPEFEGLFMPRILGYSVLRGVVDENFKYVRPQNHFKNLLIKICSSANFDMIKLRIGQTVQIGFALSSDIWITSLIESLSFKKVKQFLGAQKLDKYKTPEGRKEGYIKYKNQFVSQTFYTFETPETASALKSVYPAIENFIQSRTKKGLDNSSVLDSFFTMLADDDIKHASDYPKLVLLAGNYFELEEDQINTLSSIFDEYKDDSNFNDAYFEYLSTLLEKGEPVNGIADVVMQEVLGDENNSEIGHYYNTSSQIFIDNLLDEEIIDTVKTYYAKYDGLSVNNECLRLNILKHFKEAFAAFNEEEYANWMELNKTFAVYMDIFQNERFNLSIKALTVRYIKKLIKYFTDKRGREYQEVKKFSTRIFLEYGFFTDKEIKDFFKTPRTKK